MTFADVPEQDEFTYRKTHYVRITAGVPLRLRILDKKAYHVQKYFIPSQRISILALDESVDPIWRNNEKLMRENPDAKNPTQIPGFIRRQNRYMVNVLNRTMVKRSPAGNIVYAIGGQFPTNDPETGELLVNIDPQPLNRVEVLERGPQLFAQLNSVNQSTVDEAGNPIGIWNYDIIINATGSGRKMMTNITPRPDLNDDVELPEGQEKYALETLGIQLSPDEMIAVVKGVSLRDIFEARRSDDEVALEREETQVSEEIEGKLNDLFEQ